MDKPCRFEFLFKIFFGLDKIRQQNDQKWKNEKKYLLKDFT